MAPMVAILTLIRNRDCLMCYLRHRMERIENMRWDVGDMPEDQTANMSEHERLFTQEYNTLLSAPCSELPQPPPSPHLTHPTRPHACTHPTPPRPVPLQVNTSSRTMWTSRVISSPQTTTFLFGCGLRPACLHGGTPASLACDPPAGPSADHAMPHGPVRLLLCSAHYYFYWYLLTTSSHALRLASTHRVVHTPYR